MSSLWCPPLIIYSDRVVQCACKDFRKFLKDHGIIQSMSRKGECWDNAVVESFFEIPEVGVDFS
jgi:transposase InsO family protein